MSGGFTIAVAKVKSFAAGDVWSAGIFVLEPCEGIRVSIAMARIMQVLQRLFPVGLPRFCQVAMMLCTAGLECRPKPRRNK